MNFFTICGEFFHQQVLSPSFKDFRLPLSLIFPLSSSLSQRLVVNFFTTRRFFVCFPRFPKNLRPKGTPAKGQQ